MNQENTDFVLEKSPPAPPDNTAQIKRVLEAVLLSATQPLTVSELRKVFDTEISADLVRTLLNELRAEWEMRPLELLPLASGWRFRTRAEFLPYLERLNPEKPPKYSRAVLETLGVHDVVTKSVGTSNPYNMIRATFEALGEQTSPKSVAQRRGKKIADLLGRGHGATAETAEADAAAIAE